MNKRANGVGISRRRALAGVAGLVATGGVWPPGHRGARADEAGGLGPATRIAESAGGVAIWQVTSARVAQSNIYCEVPYCSKDSRYFVYERQAARPGNNPTELVAVELGVWKQHVIGRTTGLGGSAISHDGVFYYVNKGDDGRWQLLRVDLAEGTPQPVHELRGPHRPSSLGTIAPGGRYYAFGTHLDDQRTNFGIVLVDLRAGTEEVIDQDPYILNPHPQFDPGNAGRLLIQHNRGGKYGPDGKLERLVGPEGATLYWLAVPDGKRTTLPIGTPHTTPVTGHEAWAGTTGEVLLTVAAQGAFAPEKGNLLGVRAGGKARTVAGGFKFNHLGLSRDGRLFTCDDWQGNAKIVLGSVKSGKTAVVCESKASMRRPQNTHPHAYLTANEQWVIFNSDRSGFPHVHAARIPREFIDRLALEDKTGQV